MTARLFVLCLPCLLAIPAAADDDGRGKCLAAPDYSCLIGYAVAVAERIGRASDKARVLEHIAGVQVSAGDTKGALATAERIERSSHKAWALHRIAAAQAEAGDPKAALATVEKALATVEGIQRAYDKASALAYIAAAQARAGDAESAREFRFGARDRRDYRTCFGRGLGSA